MKHKTTIDTATIPADILKRIEEASEQRFAVWPPWKDEVLLKYWEIKDKGEISAILNSNSSTCRNRWRKLRNEGRK